MNRDEYLAAEREWRKVTDIRVGSRVKVLSLWALDSWQLDSRYSTGNAWLEYVPMGMIATINGFIYGGVELLTDRPIPSGPPGSPPKSNFFVPFWVLVKVEDDNNDG